MGNSPVKLIQVHNATSETIKICLMDSKNRPTDGIISANETWKKELEDSSDPVSIMIIPLTPEQNSFSYALYGIESLVIKRKSGKLVLIPSMNACPKTEWKHSIYSHRPCGELLGMKDPHCPWKGCIIFNESHETIEICVWDHNQRNTQIILEHAEHKIVITGTDRDSSTGYPMLSVFLVDGNSNNADKPIPKAKCSINSCIHINHNKPPRFLRVIKKDGYFTIEEDYFEVYCTENSIEAPNSYLLTKECCTKMRKYKKREIVKTGENKYDVVEKPDTCILM